MFGAPICLKSVPSLLHQLYSKGTLCFFLIFSPIHSRNPPILQEHQNANLITLFMCVCVCMQQDGYACISVSVCVCLCQCALIQYSNTPLVLLHQGNIKSSSITASRCFINCSRLTSTKNWA